MNERALADVLLARALEASDPQQRIATEAIRRQADRFAHVEIRPHDSERAKQERFLARRAEALLNAVAETHPAVLTLRTHGRFLSALPAVAFAVGVASDFLGGGRVINLIAAPILLALVWNIVVYAALALRTAFSRQSAVAARGLRALFHAASSRLPAIARDEPVILDAGRRFASDWWPRVRPLQLARIATTLHLSAALFAVGAIAGMYSRGLGFEYRAGWESTFLSADGVHSILRVALAPGAALLGRQIPDAAHVGTLKLDDGAGGENAAPWIHLYAATAFVMIIAPRLILALFGWLRAVRLRRGLSLPIESSDLARLLPPGLAPAAAIEVIPYSYHLDKGAEARVLAHLEKIFGAAAAIRIAPPLAFGGEAPQSKSGCALLFSLAATPEPEVHGALIESVNPAPRVLVDEAPYRARFGSQAGFERQLEARREIWRRLCLAHRVEPEFVSS